MRVLQPAAQKNKAQTEKGRERSGILAFADAKTRLFLSLSLSFSFSRGATGEGRKKKDTNALSFWWQWKAIIERHMRNQNVSRLTPVKRELMSQKASFAFASDSRMMPNGTP